MAGQDTPSGPVEGDGHRGTPPASTSDAVIRTDLRQNSLGLVGVTMQAMKHIAFPVISTAVLVYAVLISFQPVCTTTCPASPYSWAPLVDGVWLLLGIGVLIFYRSQGREDWLRNAGAALGESEQEYEKVVGGPT